MLQWVLHVGEGIELQKFARAWQVLTPGVQVDFEVFKLSSEVFLSVGRISCTHKGWVNGEIDLQVEFKLLRDEIFLAEHDWQMSIPEGEEVFSLSCVEGLAHLLDAALRVLAETAL